jgi:hypothetical protein
MTSLVLKGDPAETSSARFLGCLVLRATPSAPVWGQLCGPLLPIVLRRSLLKSSSLLTISVFCWGACDREIGPHKVTSLVPSRSPLAYYYGSIVSSMSFLVPPPNRAGNRLSRSRPSSHFSLRLCRVATSAEPRPSESLSGHGHMSTLI